jgi:hypothetical protein
MPRPMCGVLLLFEHLFDHRETATAHAACPTGIRDGVLGAGSGLDGSPNGTVTNPSTMTDDHRSCCDRAVSMNIAG